MSQIIASTYEIIEEIGSGGGGVVYLGRHLRLGKLVVLKADKRSLSTKADVLRREVDALKNLSHTYIPQVYDFVAADDTVYTVMDFIEGESLDKPLKRGESFEQAQVIEWACQLLEALTYLHSRPPHGILHSDIKPANIMRTPQGDICLIDFNIALALGEEGAVRVGFSRGYASPEHYGIDYAHIGETQGVEEDVATQLPTDPAKTVLGKGTGTGSTTDGKKSVLLDVRSDIYSLGATLYHLLAGERPSQDAKMVTPISCSGVSPAVSAIIQKAMAPDPNDRYQTAQEMLRAFERLHENDPRTKRHARRVKATALLLGLVFLAGAGMAFVGLKQMERTQNAYALAEYSDNALQAGDVTSAVSYALQALPEKRGMLDPPYTAQAQRALAQALGVYDLSDGYKHYRTLSLESAPLKVVLSSGETRAAVLTQGTLTVFDLEQGSSIARLDADVSALSDVIFLGEDQIIYAGDGALTAYDLDRQSVLWTGDAATGIALSADGGTVAAVYKKDSVAAIYDTRTGEQKSRIDFEGKHQSVPENDGFADPEDDLFALSADGHWLAVSFADGGLYIYDLFDRENDVIVYETSEYTCFEGGFCGSQFAVAASTSGQSVFAVFDLLTLEQMGAFSGTVPFYTLADEEGIYVATENVLVKLDPVTGEQTEVAYTEADISAFRVGERYTLVTTVDQKYAFFDKAANLLDSYESQERCDFVQLSDKMALLASMDVPNVRVLKLEDHARERLLSYDITYPHDEARVSMRSKSAMLFRYDAFRLYALDGSVLADVKIPDAEKVYDQQFRRTQQGDYLEVIYNDGFRRCYSAENGTEINGTQGEIPDSSMRDEFITDTLKITADLHGMPRVFDLTTGKDIAQLESEDYLTYVTQTEHGLITEYVTAQNERYGLLLDGNFEVLAMLPGLCDVLEDGTLVFDDMRGNLRQSRIYSIQELIALAKT